MSDAMVHRGADAGGTWVSAPDARSWGVLLAHRRLSILDLSSAGAQPMVDPVTDQVVVFNGEIYNFGDLRRRLVAEGRNSSPPVTPPSYCARYQPLGRKAILRGIGLRRLDPGLFERAKSEFVLPFDRWIRRGLKDVMDRPVGRCSGRSRPRSSAPQTTVPTMFRPHRRCAFDASMDATAHN
jgi:Glutamine amidotransferase domain